MSKNSITKKPFLWSFHYFRAFAILNIIFIHTWRFPPKTEYTGSSSFVDATRDMLFHGSTIYFLFISGFLFHYLSTKFNIRGYYVSKIKNVVAPYVFISIFLIFAEDFTGARANLPWSEYFFKIPRQLINGTASFQFWYIPFIILVFAISPLFLRLKERDFVRLAPWIFVLPILGTRTQVYITLGQFMYFLPVYLWGIYVSMRYAQVMETVKRYKLPLLLTAVATSVILLFVNHEYQYLGIFSPRESLVYLQKMSITFLILYISRNIQNNKYWILDIIAKISFALYFLHVIFDRHLKKIYFVVADFTPQALQVPVSIVYVLFLLTVNTLFCLLVKKILGNRSRYFIGY
ncbi:acyltransferase family protein [Flagellimonas crocea]|uniref:acyltransferase family protein n=1 Tax=Flagellimonas crocea TaxID=3067311 RepID=UPI00296F14DA|nr:acyltransferase [Muricauda sp. DH64]